MRDQQVNTFFNGMQKDLGATLPQEGSYIDGENIRIITGGKEEQSGIIVSVNGNEKILELTRTVYAPQSESAVVIYLEGEYGSNTNEEQYPVRPIGYTYIKNKLIVYGVSACSPVNCPVCENCEGDMMSSIHVIDLNTYSQEVIYKAEGLNFSTQHPIQAVGRYESEGMQRVYWTDNLNPVRTLNIMQDSVADIPVEELGLNIPINFSSPKITKINKSGSLPAGMYQYAYRLKTTEGAISRFSPLSSFTHIVSGSKYWDYQEDPENQTEYSNTTPGEITDKGVIIEIKNIDPDYDLIEVAAIYKTAADSIQSAYLIEERKIYDYDATEIQHTNDSGPAVLIEEVTEIISIPDKVKTMCVKDNRLFLANVEYSPFDLEFNARAYRYKRIDNIRYPLMSGPTSTYVDAGFNPITQEGASTYSVQDNLDAINPYNSISDKDIQGIDYKFKEDGYTLGGQGPNISYEFIKKRLSGNIGTGNYFINDQAPFVSSVFKGDEPGDYKSPENVSEFVGYHRDEIYRFGIVLYDLDGNPGFVNWIGDIKFPSYEDYDYKNGEGIYNYTLAQVYNLAGNDRYESGTNYVYSNTNVNAYEFMDVVEPDVLGQRSQYDIEDLDFNMFAGGEMFALGIKFKVNIPADIKDKISGYRIVRLERKQLDKTILGTGLLNYMSVQSYANTYQYAGFERYSSGPDNNPILPLAYRADGSDSMLITIDSPDFAFSGEYPTSDNNYIKVIGAVTGRVEDNFEGNDIGHAACFSSHLLALDESQLFSTHSIEYSTKFEVGGNLLVPGYGPLPIDDNRGVFNRYYRNDSLAGIGEETLLVKLSNINSASPYTGAPEDESGGINYIHWLKEGVGTFDPDQYAFPGTVYGGDLGTYGRGKILASVKRKLTNQYGGNTNLKRKNSAYIPAGPFINIEGSDFVDDQHLEVWGGDTYVVIYDLEKIRRHKSSDGSAPTGATASASYKKTVNFAFPVESSFNTTLRGGWHFANKKDWDADTATPLNTFDLESCYSSSNTTEVFVPKPFGFIDVPTFNSRILYSDAKINGEKIDSWRKYGIENYKDIEGSYGDINKLIVYNDIAYYLQDNAFGSLSISPVSTVVDQDGASIVLGTGDVIQDNKYISTSIGCTNPLSVINSEKGIYWVDYNKKKAYAFRANGLESISDTHGVKSWFSNNLQEDFCVLGYDYLNSEVLFSVNPESHTMVFSEALNKFTSTYSFNSSIFMSGVKGLLSVGYANAESTFIYAHNAEESTQWYDYPHYQSKLEFIVNKNPLNSKIYDTLEWYSPEGDLNSIGFSNSYVNTYDTAFNVITEEYDPLQNVYKREQMHRAAIPRDPLGGRLRDTYLKVRMIFETTGAKAVLHYVKTLFRISRR